MSDHTHGPWHLNGNGILLHPVTGSQLVSQKIETSLGSFEIFDETNEPDANAWLIAAAPDMFDALQAIVDAFGDQDSLLIDQCKAALNKAKGVK